MSTWWTRGVQWLGAVALVGTAATGVACGGGSGGGAAGDSPDAGAPKSGSGSDAGHLTGDGGSLIGNGGTIKSIAISPPTATIASINGAAATQAFTLTSLTRTARSMPLSTASVRGRSDSAASAPSARRGLYTANGSLGGVVHVQRLVHRARTRRRR